MENASKALLMAGGILLGILILTLMVTLFASSQEVSQAYEKEKQAEAIQQFNTNFTKYLGQDLNIHQVVTITNFASENNVKVDDGYTQIHIDNYEKETIKTYKLNIEEYSDNGYIKHISFR